MKRESTLSIGPGQTIPDIFAAHGRFPVEHSIESCHLQWMMNWTVAGLCEWRIEERTYRVSAGDLLVTRPNTPMAWRVLRPDLDCRDSNNDHNSSWDTIYTVFHPRPHWRVWLDALEYREGMAHVRFDGAARDEMQAAFLELIDVYYGAGFLRDERSMLALENLLLTLHTHTARRQLSPNPRIHSAIDLIHSRFHEPLTLPQIAQAAGVSVSRLLTLFESELHATPGAYLEQVRLGRAAVMLRFGAMSIGEIAAATGYTEQNYFARRFHLRYGQTPTGYRAAAQGRMLDADMSQ